MAYSLCRVRVQEQEMPRLLSCPYSTHVHLLSLANQRWVEESGSRLILLGLSTGCALCSHRTHHQCFKKHFTASSGSTTCPGCMCKCVADGGVTMSSVTVQPVIQPVATFSRGSNRPSINPLSANPSSRMTYASLKTIREHDSPADASALGLSPDNDLATPKSADVIPEQSSGWLGWEPRIHWGHREDSPNLANLDQETLPSGLDNRPPSRGNDGRARSRTREGPLMDQPVPAREGSGIGSRMRLSAFRTGEVWRQKQ